MQKRFSFPRMGIYTDYFLDLVNDIGGEVIKPPKITKETIKLGIQYSTIVLSVGATDSNPEGGIDGMVSIMPRVSLPNTLVRVNKTSTL